MAIIMPRFAPKAEACRWFARSPIPGFNGKIADQLVEDGLCPAVISLIESVDAGIHV